jgi:hypothetical protein
MAASHSITSSVIVVRLRGESVPRAVYVIKMDKRTSDKEADVRVGSKTVLTPLKSDVCTTSRKQTSVSYAADCEVISCYGCSNGHSISVMRRAKKGKSLNPS